MKIGNANKVFALSEYGIYIDLERGKIKNRQERKWLAFLRLNISAPSPPLLLPPRASS